MMGIFGLISASKRDLVARLRRRRGFVRSRPPRARRPRARLPCVAPEWLTVRKLQVIYPGGMAEMFFSSPAVEKLYLSKRKGFIRLAIMHGADVVPTYIFGNTTALRVVQNPLLEWVSRKLKVSVTIFYGRWLLPVPFPVEIMVRRPRTSPAPTERRPRDADRRPQSSTCAARY